jgi:hypothetical protein
MQIKLLQSKHIAKERMLKSLLLRTAFGILFSIIASATFAQTGTVKGVVLDSKPARR